MKKTMIPTTTLFSIPISITSKERALAVVEKWVKENRQPVAAAKLVSTSVKRQASLTRNASRLSIPTSQPQPPHDSFPKLIATPNPEMIVAAQQDPEFLRALQSADLAIPDGIGVVWAIKLLGKKLWVMGYGSGVSHGDESLDSPTPPLPNSQLTTHNSQLSRLSGLDLMEALIEKASHEGWKVMLVGGKPGIAQRAAKILSENSENSDSRNVRTSDDQTIRQTDKQINRQTSSRFIRLSDTPMIRSSGSPSFPSVLKIEPLSGPQHIERASPHELNELIKQINDFSPDLLFVAFGHGKQEKWLTAHRHQLHAGVAMGVGGALDQIADPSLRPPHPIDSIGLGWLYRLIREPWRWRRQLALVKFVEMAVGERIKSIKRIRSIRG